MLLDPPYAKEQIVANITQLEEQGLLAEEVMLVCETDKAVDLLKKFQTLGFGSRKPMVSVADRLRALAFWIGKL